MHRPPTPANAAARATATFARWTTGLLAAGLTASGLTSCGDARSVEIPPAADMPRPAFVERPSDLADSPQLDAVLARDTAGLDAADNPAAAELLGPALAALAASREAPSELTRLSIYEDSVYATFFEGGIEGRAVTAIYRLPYEGSTATAPVLTFTEPRFDDQPTFPLEGLDPEVPGRLVAALETRFPHTAVPSIDLDATPSSGYGPVWEVQVNDARGALATITADIDGSIVAVDLA